MPWSEPREGKNREPPFLHSLSFHSRLLGDSLLCYVIPMFKNIFPTCGNAKRTVSGVGNGNPLQYSCLQNPMDRGAWRTTVHRVTKSQTQLKQLSTHARPRCYNRHFRYVNRCECECESCSFTSNSLQPHGLHSPWNSLGQNTGVGSCSLLQGIFPGLPHCRWILYQLSHQGSP